MNRSQPFLPIVSVQPVQHVQDQPVDPKDQIICSLEETVRKLQVQNNEKDAIIKSQEDIITRLKEEIDSLMKKTPEGKSSSLSKPPLTMQDTKFDEDSDDMVPKL
jgi:predicted RNase H-like nuclease (RuvC/YqgF family)